MIDPGDIHMAALNEETLRRVAVVSPRRFNELSGRVIVVPEVPLVDGEVQPPWRIEGDEGVFAVDFIRGLPVDRVLKQVDRMSPEGFRRLRRAAQELV